MDVLGKLRTTGQSLWLEHVTRELIRDGSLALFIEDWSITGMSFSPEAFHHVLSNSRAYDSAILERIGKGLYGANLVKSLILEDVRCAADLLRHVHDRTDGIDGWAILPVTHISICDTDILAEAITDLHTRVHRPNTLVTVFGISENLEVIENLVFEGVPVNIAFIYSHDQYLRAADAYLRGIERRIAAGLKPAVQAFISISISRLEAALSRQMSRKAAIHLAITMARKIYNAMRTLHSSRQWERAYNSGAKPLKIIWNGSNYENDTYSAISLFKNLIAPFTIASLPRQTIEKFLFDKTPDTMMADDGGDWDETLEHNLTTGLNFESIADNSQTNDVSEQVQKWIMLLEIVAKKSAAIIQNKNTRSVEEDKNEIYQ